MGRITKSLFGAFLAANTMAAVGAYQGVNEMAQNPFLDQDDVKSAMVRRPLENLSRVVLGDQGEQYTLYAQMGLGEDDSLDAELSRFFGNAVLNKGDYETTYEKTRFPKMIGLTAMALTSPGSYIGGVAGYNMAYITAE